MAGYTEWCWDGFKGHLEKLGGGREGRFQEKKKGIAGSHRALTVGGQDGCDVQTEWEQYSCGGWWVGRGHSLEMDAGVSPCPRRHPGLHL